MKLKNNLLILLAIFLALTTQAQQQVTFDLNSSTFSKKLSYLENITIEGLPEKNGKKIQAIQLTIKTLSNKTIKKINNRLIDIAKEEIKIDKEKTKIKAIPSPTKSDSSDLLKHQIKKDKLIAEYDELEKSKYKKDSLVNSVWYNKGDETKFQFSLVNKLKMETKYEFIFTLFSKNEKPYPIDDAFKNVEKNLDNYFVTNNGIDPSKVDSLISIEIDTINKNYFGPKIYVSNENTLKKHNGSISNTTKLKLQTYFRKLYVKKYNNESQENTIKTNNVLILGKLFENNNMAAFNIKYLEKACSNADSKAFQEWLNSNTSIDTTNARIAKSMVKSLNSLPIKKVKEYKESIAHLQDSVKKFIDTEVKNIYIADDIIPVSKSAASASTDLEGKKIGTIYGLAVIPFGEKGDYWGVTELMQYVGLNFRLGSYDNELIGKEAYKSCLSHFSFLFGMVTTDNIEYKGQQIRNTRLGFKPIIGFSYEPIQQINISIGTMGFLQDPISSERSYSLTKFRPFVSIAFDFNIVNYLIKLKDK